MSSMLPLATIIDWQALLETALAAIVSGVGVAFTFSLAILGSTKVAEYSRAQAPVYVAFWGALAVFGFAATAAAIVFGIFVMTE